VDSSLQSLETAFLNKVRATELQRSEPFDLYGGVEQKVTYVTPELTTMTCNEQNAPAPNHLRALIPSFDLYNLADYLRLGKLTVCAHYEGLDSAHQLYLPAIDR
jgi:hypothetical protein